MKRYAQSIARQGKAIALAVAVSAATLVTLPAPHAQADELAELKKTFAIQYQYGKFKEILMTLHKMEATAKAAFGEGHERHIRVMDRLANQYKIIGRKEISEKFLKGAIALADAKHGKESKIALIPRHSLGVLYVGQDRKDDAKKMFQEALAISEKVFGADDMETIVMKNNLAMISK